MGNCLRKNQVSAAQDENFEPQLESNEAKLMKKKSCLLSKLEAARREQRMKKVRFKIQNDDIGDGGNCRSGTVRIRMVVTQEELKRILSSENDAQETSLEQLLRAVKLRGRRVSEVGEYEGGIVNSWRPALGSIPEGRSM